MQAEEKLRAAVADTDDPNQADFDDYLLFLQEKAVDYLSEVLVPANLDQVNTSAFVDGAFDASLEENQREKFEKG